MIVFWEEKEGMKKPVMLLIVLMVISVVLLSGCTGPQDAVEDAGTCCVLGIIGVVLFIILIAYLLGGKKTVVQTQQSAAPPVIIRETSKVEKEKAEKTERKCPDCGRNIPFDAKLCPYCGKKFKLHFEEEPKIEKKQEKVEEKNNIPKYCAKCGTRTEKALNFCTNCGNKLS